MYYLIYNGQQIAQSKEEIVYVESELAWHLPGMYICDPNHEMYVEYIPQTNDGGPDVVA